MARGDTLVVIEHHPDVIRGADWVVELGPEGGDGGGSVVFEGEPRKLAKASTPTGRVLAAQALGRMRSRTNEGNEKRPGNARAMLGEL